MCGEGSWLLQYVSHSVPVKGELGRERKGIKIDGCRRGPKLEARREREVLSNLAAGSESSRLQAAGWPVQSTLDSPKLHLSKTQYTVNSTIERQQSSDVRIGAEFESFFMKL